MIVSTHGIIASQAVSFIGLLDLYPNAAAAYSVRKLRAAYTGSAIRVRRSSDNAEQDIGFDGAGNLNTSALTSFVGASDGFVATWYDQSGNGRDASIATGVLQPQIISSGSVYQVGTKPAVRFNGNNSLRFASTQFNYGANHFQSFVGRTNVSNGRLLFVGTTNADGYTLGNVGFASAGDWVLWSNNNLRISNATENTQNIYYVVTGIVSGATFEIYKNNNVIPATNNGSTTVNGIIAIGQSGLFYAQADLQEGIFYNSDQSANRTAINSNINSYYAIY